ncbi:PQQ-binding-like beta-propeller repeat protein [Roseiconus nitratireducens]|uniref:PQQ-binding-like beta-propeller repeat protein n=1 Tax=Roseiconus nitratireducens TaxID=2605748 RepID=A0A5M6DLV7_9BACT|nr:PQQ-binding-like beta-propeller repeat protein [Roseiconus nitratireducens]
MGPGYGLGSVAEGRYFHFDAADSDEGRVQRLRAFDLQSGQPLWSVQQPFDYRDLYGYEAGPRGTPTVAGDKVFTMGVDGVLCCRRVEDGKLEWSVDTNERYGVVQNFFGVGSSPLIHEDKVIVQVGGSPPEDQAIAPGRLDRVIPNGSAVIAFDRDSGKEVWRCGQDLASYSSPRTLQIGSQTVVLMFARNHLLAIDPEQGKVLWEHRHRADLLESVNAMMPVVRGDQVFISECYDIGGALLQVTLDGVQRIWEDAGKPRRNQAMRCHWSTPILIDGYLYGCSGRNNPDSDFRCVRWDTGEVAWNDERRIRTSVTLAGDHLVVWDEKGRMQIVRPTPERLDVVAEYDFRDRLSYYCWAAPIVVGNRMLIRGDENVLCLALDVSE